MKLRHDFAGHYNRPDIFHLHINRAAPRLYSVHNGDDNLALANGNGTARLGTSDTPTALLTADTGTLRGDGASSEAEMDRNDGRDRP
jgi:aliphatic nitrilase